MRVGTYNVEFGHPKQEHAEMIVERFQREKLDVLALVEVQDYVADIKKIIKTLGFELISIHNRRGSQNIGILVRNQSEIERYWTFIAGKPYFRKGGGKMAPTMPLAAEIDGVLYVAVHAPVEAWVATKDGRKFAGPARRRAAYIFFVNRLALLAARHRHTPVVMLGDWNAPPIPLGRFSPNWLRRKIKGHFARPHASTGHGEIDFAIVRGAKTKAVMVLPNPHDLPGSDHKLVTMEVIA